MLHPNLAGALPLQDMIAATIEQARTKLAAAEESEKAKKLIEYEKKEHGKIPSPKEEEKEHKNDKEKKSSVLNSSDPEEMTKLAEALDEMGDDFIKEADAINNGGESHQGGQQLPTNGPVGGKQSYKKDSAHHQVPNATGLEKKPETGPAATAVPDTQHKPPVPLTAAYPKKGVLKTAGELCEKCKKEPCTCKEKKSTVELLQGALEKMSGAEYGEAEKKEQQRTARGAGRIAGARALAGAALATGAAAHYRRPLAHILAAAGERAGKGTPKRTIAAALAKKAKNFGYGKAALTTAGLTAATYGAGRLGTRLNNRVSRAVGQIGEKEKKSAVEFILEKAAEYHGGGETLDSKSGSGPKPPSNPGRQLIANNKAPVSATKREAKAPRKPELAQVLTEPALTKSTDSVVQDNLRNASKGGVKIAEAAKEALQKIASDPNDPKHEALKKAIAERKAEKEKGEKKEGEKKEEEKKS